MVENGKVLRPDYIKRLEVTAEIQVWWYHFVNEAYYASQLKIRHWCEVGKLWKEIQWTVLVGCWRYALVMGATLLFSPWTVTSHGLQQWPPFSWAALLSSPWTGNHLWCSFCSPAPCHALLCLQLGVTVQEHTLMMVTETSGTCSSASWTDFLAEKLRALLMMWKAIQLYQPSSLLDTSSTHFIVLKLAGFACPFS